jgi:hypothetical protein
VQSDTEVLLRVTSVMLGGFHWAILLLEVVQNTLMWNGTVGLSLLYIMSQTDIIKNNFPTVMKTKPVFQDIYIYIYV